MSEAATPTAPVRKLTRIKIGVVTSDKQDKTRTVSVAYQQRHPKYNKYLKRRQKFHVHDEANKSREGDRVEIAPCRPFSKSKSWRLIRVVEAATSEV